MTVAAINGAVHEELARLLEAQFDLRENPDTAPDDAASGAEIDRRAVVGVHRHDAELVGNPALEAEHLRLVAIAPGDDVDLDRFVVVAAGLAGLHAGHAGFLLVMTAGFAHASADLDAAVGQRVRLEELLGLALERLGRDGAAAAAVLHAAHGHAVSLARGQKIEAGGGRAVGGPQDVEAQSTEPAARYEPAAGRQMRPRAAFGWLVFLALCHRAIPSLSSHRSDAASAAAGSDIVALCRLPDGSVAWPVPGAIAALAMAPPASIGRSIGEKSAAARPRGSRSPASRYGEGGGGARMVLARVVRI